MENLVNSSPLILVLVFLVIGFVFLMKGADFFVEGSSSIAKRLKVPPIIIGLTIVAMGTSLPETAVSVTASLVNNNELAVSNVVGSNIFNLMVVVGVCSILTPILVPIAVKLGIDPVFFGVIMTTNLAIGCITPPVGVDLFVASSISKVSMTRLSSAIVSFVAVLVVVQIVITYIPGLVMWLPNVLK